MKGNLKTLGIISAIALMMSACTTTTQIVEREKDVVPTL